MFGLGQGKIAENGARLLGSKFDEAAVESDREPPRQRDGKARRGSWHGCGLPLSQRMKISRLPHPKKSAPGGRSFPDYIKAPPPSYAAPPPPPPTPPLT